jgi:hypothetical protein
MPAARIFVCRGQECPALALGHTDDGGCGQLQGNRTLDRVRPPSKGEKNFYTPMVGSNHTAHALPLCTITTLLACDM